MGRWILTAIVGAVLLSMASVQSSPLKGQRRQPGDFDKKRGRLKVGGMYTFREAFRGNERACVFVEGDHNPEQNLKVVVTDSHGNIVAQDNGPGDFLAAIWYPPRTEEFEITITGDGKDYNDLDIVVK
jgi:hypothetical protein